MADKTTKIIDFKVDGIQQAVKSSEELKGEFEQIKRLAKDMGLAGTANQIKALRREMREFANSVVQAVQDTQKLKKAVDKVSNETKRLSVGRFSQELNKLISGGSFGGGFLGGLIGGGLSSAIDSATSALIDFVFAETEATKKAREIKEATEAAASAVAEESVLLETNYNILTDTTASQEQRLEALENLQEEFPDYFENLDLEAVKNGEAEKSYNALTIAIQRRIEVMALQELAQQKFVKLTELQTQQDKINNATTEEKARLNQFYANQLGIIGSAMNMVGVETGVATSLTEKLTNQIAKTKAEYEALLNQLAELNKQQITNGETSSKKSEKSAKSEERARKAVAEGVTDLESAIRRLNEISTFGTQQEIQDMRELVLLYEKQAEEKLRAAGATDELSGKTQEQLTDELLKNQLILNQTKEKIDLEKKSIDEAIKRYEILGVRGDETFELTQKAEDQARKLLAELVVEYAMAGKEISKVFDDIRLSSLLFTGAFFDQIGFGTGIDAEKAAKNIVESIGIQKAAEEVIKINQNEIEILKKQEEKLGTDISEIRKKTNDAILKSEEEEINRRVEADKKRAEALAKSPEFTAVLLERAGALSLEVIKKNLKAQADAALDAAFSAEDEFVRAATKIASDFAGFQVIGGSADEGFFLTKEAREKFLPAEVAQLEKIAKDANERLVLAKREYNLKITKLDIDAQDQLIKNAAIAAEIELRQAKANQKTLELTFDELYDKLFTLDSEFADNKLKTGEKFNAQEIDQVKAHIDELVKLRNAALEQELQAETDKYIKIFNEQAGNADKQVIVLQELQNKRRDIINKAEKDIADIQGNFNKLLETEKFELTSQQIISIVEQSLSAIQNLVNGFIDYQNQLIQNSIDNLTQQISTVDAEISRAQTNINELESDLEGKRSGRREAVLRGIEQEKEREEDLVNAKIELQRKLAKEEQKQAKLRQGQAIANALIAGALASIQLWSNNTIPYPAALAFNIPMQAFLIGLTAAQVATISAQKFADGGYTETDAAKLGAVDETGYRVAGIVHEGEYVIPEWMVSSPKYAPIVQQIENERTGKSQAIKRTAKFADGGFANLDIIAQSVSPNLDNRITAALDRFTSTAIALSDRPTYVNVTEISNVASNRAKRVNVTTIGG